MLLVLWAHQHFPRVLSPAVTWSDAAGRSRRHGGVGGMGGCSWMELPEIHVAQVFKCQNDCGV